MLAPWHGADGHLCFKTASNSWCLAGGWNCQMAFAILLRPSDTYQSGSLHNLWHHPNTLPQPSPPPLQLPPQSSPLLLLSPACAVAIAVAVTRCPRVADAAADVSSATALSCLLSVVCCPRPLPLLSLPPPSSLSQPPPLSLLLLPSPPSQSLQQAMPWEDKEVHRSWDKSINLPKLCAVLHMASAPPNYQREFGGDV